MFGIIVRMNGLTFNELNKQPLIIGIDATNIRQGGGRTHLIELLCAATPQ